MSNPENERVSSIPMFGANGQIPNEGRLGMAKTVSDPSAATAASKQLTKGIIETIENRNIEGADSLANNLQKSLIVRRVADAIPDPANEHDKPLESLVRVIDQTIALAKQEAGATVREATKQARQVLDELCGELSTTLMQNGCDVNPAGLPALIPEIKRVIADINFSGGDNGVTGRLTKLRHLIEQLPSLESSLTPSAFALLNQELLRQPDRVKEQRAQALYPIMQTQWLERVQQIHRVLDEAQEVAVKFEEKTRAMNQDLESREHQLLGAEAPAKTLGVALPAPDADVVLTALKTELSASDEADLVKQLVPHWESRLRSWASENVPEINANKVGLPRLILAIPHEVLADQVVALVIEKAGRCQSIFERIRLYGVKQLADALCEQAAPSGYLSFNHRRHGINCVELYIARLPKPENGADQRIYNEFESALRRHHRGMEIYTSPGMNDVVVFRILAGAIPAIATENLTLLRAYQRSAEEGHLPHLLGVIDDSELGKPSTAHLQL